jgi:hypothetical protein
MTSDLLHPFPLSLVLGFTFRAKTPVPEQERIWEELVNWLELRQLFVGGNASCAFVLVTGNGPPFATELRQWIATASARPPASMRVAAGYQLICNIPCNIRPEML